MRTTLDIRDDLLQAAREEALRSRQSVGEVISTWAARGLHAPLMVAEPRPTYRAGFAQLPPRDGVVSNEQVDALRDELGV